MKDEELMPEVRAAKQTFLNVFKDILPTSGETFTVQSGNEITKRIGAISHLFDELNALIQKEQECVPEFASYHIGFIEFFAGELVKKAGKLAQEQKLTRKLAAEIGGSPYEQDNQQK